MDLPGGNPGRREGRREGEPWPEDTGYEDHQFVSAVLLVNKHGGRRGCDCKSSFATVWSCPYSRGKVCLISLNHLNLRSRLGLTSAYFSFAGNCCICAEEAMLWQSLRALKRKCQLTVSLLLYFFSYTCSVLLVLNIIKIYGYLHSCIGDSLMSTKHRIQNSNCN